LDRGELLSEPRQSAISILYEILGDAVFEMRHLAPIKTLTADEASQMRTTLQNRSHLRWSSSAGRLIDAVASILGLKHSTTFNGQTSMVLEAALQGIKTAQDYPFGIFIDNDEHMVIDWVLLIQAILEDMGKGVPVGEICTRFHNTLVEMIVEVARYIGEKQVVLTGRCFQSKYLAEHTIQRLRDEGFTPYWHQLIPPNDGGIALGQIIAAARAYKHTIDVFKSTPQNFNINVDR
jgi:hydrogenase maturation protein HypF